MTDKTLNSPLSRDASEGVVQRLYIDQSHVRRQLTGIERVAVELFAPEALAPHDVRPVRCRSLIEMVITQHVVLPILGLLKRSAWFVFPGFPPSPLSVALGKRCLIFVHDTFLLTRPQDLNWKARLYMKPSFAWAIRHGRNFLVNSETTGRALRRLTSADARISLLRPRVRDVFGLANEPCSAPWSPGTPLRILAIGTIEPRKNYPAAVEIVRALNASGVPAELHLVGRVGWGHHEFLSNPPPFLTLHGYVDDAGLRRVMKGCHLLLSTSSAEGLGLPLLEVQHGSLPVVAPKGEVFDEVLGSSGLLIDVSNPQRAAQMIASLATDPDRLGAAAIASRANVARWNNLAADDLNRFRAYIAQGLTDRSASDSAEHETLKPRPRL
jgi:glycosyltransferase involved in cell wall biosynthesis